MYRNILVPLDGSEFAECSLAHAKAIAKGCNATEVIAFRVIEPLPERVARTLMSAGGDMLQKTEQEIRKSVRDYISKVEHDLKKEGFPCRGVVKDGSAADEIIEYSKKNEVDLIVMSTHGRSGISHFYYGSVAEKVSRHSPIPVLTVLPQGCRITPAS